MHYGNCVNHFYAKTASSHAGCAYCTRSHNLPSHFESRHYGGRFLVTDADIGARVRQARVQAGFKSGAAFAKRLGLSQSTVSRIESGTRRVTAAELAAIAAELGRDPHAFLRSQSGSVFYRRDAEQTLTPAAEQALSWLEGFAERLRVLREYTDKLEWPKPYSINIDAPASFEDAQAKAYEVRQFLGVGTGPAPDMFAILERVGCAVVVRDIADGYEAMYVPQPSGIVLLNGTNRAGVRQRFTLAHELAHHLFHRDGVVVDNDLFGGNWRLDQIANSFGAHFLMPRQGIEVEMLRRFGIATPSSAEHAHWLAHHFGVSIEALCYQLVNTKLASVQETSWWKHANRKAIASALDLVSNQQYRGVTSRWPPEMVQRLGYLFGQGVLDRDALEAHLDQDGETVDQILESVSA